MKKLCVLLALVLALTCLPAMAAEGDALLGRGGDDGNLYFNYCFAEGDTLYASGYSSIYTYHLGDPDLREYVFVHPEDEESTRDYTVLPFASDGQLYALYLVTRYAEVTEFEGAHITAMTLNDDNTAIFEPVCDVDWSDLIEYYDDNAYPGRPDCVLGLQGGKAFVRCYDVQGNGDYAIFTIDVNTGKREPVDGLRNVMAVTPYKDSMVLVEQYDYNNNTVADLAVYDPAGDSVQPLAQIKVNEYSPLVGLGYDPDTDTVYCVRGGEVCPVDLQAGEILAGVTDMPLDNYGNVMAACVMPGGYFIFTGDGLAVRNLDPAQKAEIRLKINDNSWQEAVNNAYYRFANAHGDISVVLSREYSEVEHLIESMMNRDDSIDIYTLTSSTPTFEALYNRGYLMELDGNEKLSAFADSMYPSLRERLSSNGHLVALPLSAWAYTIGINEKALESLGKSMADVPDNWPEFLDFVAGLKDVINEDSKVKLFYPGYTAEDAKNELFYAIFEDYQRYVNRTDPAMGYNTEMLQGLLKKLDQVDFVAMGYQPAAERDEHASDDYEYVENGMLLQTGTGCTIGNYYGDCTPLLLGMAPGMTTPITLETTVAFVNPFTKHPDVALAFMEELADNLPAAARYCFDPSLSEPIRGKWNEQAMAEWQKQLEELKADLEKADPADRQMIEDSIHDTEQTLQYYEENAWDVGPKDLEWYRAHDENITIAASNWLYSENGGEASELIQQYCEGNLSAEDMLSGIDKKVQMMLLEGN